MRGMGLTMEGQEGNEIVYDILLDQVWFATPINVSTYIRKWVSRRYNVHPLPPLVQDAWNILASTIYNNSQESVIGVTKSVFELAPALSGLVNRTGPQPTMLFYDTNTTVVPVLSMLFNASRQNPALQKIPEFALDIVDIGRQLLANRFLDAYNRLVVTYNDTSTTGSDVRHASQPLVSILSDLDDLLYTNEHFLLSKWISDARRWAQNSTDANYASFLEYNARNQVTLWGPNDEVDDYASKQWAGLVGTYYLPRWHLFAEYLEDTKSFGSSSFNTTYFASQLLDLGMKWDNETWGLRSGEIWETRGDTWQGQSITQPSYSARNYLFSWGGEAKTTGTIKYFY
ncbi:hypothetical protein Clacol_005083 [Clathrus columnatus]|uniref:Alpha-N-acetylglucosaminidase C-terminal domain-containing protein n=1 Tax=Clathrus columnatus TaxID=1419009 RepID=A0AAV5AFY8_9AGAM|nr:hypothetical protein Clacol_005083 [Clathrus columnatus]